MLQTDYVIGSPLNHQDPFIQRHGSQLTANELPPFRQPFTSRRGIRLAYSFPGPARGGWGGGGACAETKIGWLVDFRLNDPLRQYFSLYRVVSQREGERAEKGQTRAKMSKQPPPALTARAVGPCPTLIQTSRTPRHWKFTQDHRTTRPPPKPK